MADQLRPFAGLSLADFGGFLVKAEAYSRGDLESVFGKKGKTPARQPKPPADPDRVPAAVGRLKTLYDRALDPSVTPETVEAGVGGLKDFSKAELDEIAAACGFRQKFKSKPAVLAALRKWILDRKGSYERAPV